MRTYIAVTAFAVFLGLASLVQAAQLLSPPLPTDGRINVGIYGACRILNTGTTPVSVQVSLVSNNGVGVMDIDTCNQAPLAGGGACMVMTDELPDDSFVACKVTASNVSSLRGTLEIGEFDHESRVRAAEDLR